MSWRGESRRHALASRGIKTALPHKPMITAPLQSKATILPIQFAIHVPSTNYDKKISEPAFKKRIENTAKELSNRFGGDTAVRGKGDYTSDGKLIREDVVVIESSMTEDDYKKNKRAIGNFIKEKQKKWKQESIGYSFEDKFYIYPAFN